MSEVHLANMLDTVASRGDYIRWLRQVFTPLDALLPSVAERLALENDFERPDDWRLEVPEDSTKLPAFAKAVDEVRSAQHGFQPKTAFPSVTGPPEGGPWGWEDVAGPGDSAEASERIGLDLGVLAWRRWRLLTTTPFLLEACRLVVHSDPQYDPLSAAIVLTLAAAPGQSSGPDGLLMFDGTPLSLVIDRYLRDRRGVALVLAQGPMELAMTIVQVGGAMHSTSDREKLADLLRRSHTAAPAEVKRIERQMLDLISKRQDRIGHLLAYLLGPDPLEMLTRRVLGLRYDSIL
jgi:hypothetical protein